MSTYLVQRAEADPYEPALCQAAMELLPQFGLMDRDSNPVFVKSTEYEDKALGIDMHMLTSSGAYKLAFRAQDYLGSILLRGPEMEKIKAGKYEPDFFIIGVKNPEDYSLSDARVIALNDWIAHNKDAIEYDDLGEKRPDDRGEGHFYKIPPIDKQWQAIYYPMSISGTRRVPYKAFNKTPVIFLSMAHYEEACALSMCEDFRVEDYLWKP